MFKQSRISDDIAANYGNRRVFIAQRSAVSGFYSSGSNQNFEQPGQFSTLSDEYSTILEKQKALIRIYMKMNNGKLPPTNNIKMNSGIFGNIKGLLDSSSLPSSIYNPYMQLSSLIIDGLLNAGANRFGNLQNPNNISAANASILSNSSMRFDGISNIGMSFDSSSFGGMFSDSSSSSSSSGGGQPPPPGAPGAPASNHPSRLLNTSMGSSLRGSITSSSGSNPVAPWSGMGSSMAGMSGFGFGTTSGGLIGLPSVGSKRPAASSLDMGSSIKLNLPSSESSQSSWGMGSMHGSMFDRMADKIRQDAARLFERRRIPMPPSANNEFGKAVIDKVAEEVKNPAEPSIAMKTIVEEQAVMNNSVRSSQPLIQSVSYRGLADALDGIVGGQPPIINNISKKVEEAAVKISQSLINKSIQIGQGRPGSVDKPPTGFKISREEIKKEMENLINDSSIPEKVIDDAADAGFLWITNNIMGKSVSVLYSMRADTVRESVIKSMREFVRNSIKVAGSIPSFHGAELNAEVPYKIEKKEPGIEFKQSELPGGAMPPPILDIGLNSSAKRLVNNRYKKVFEPQFDEPAEALIGMVDADAAGDKLVVDQNAAARVMNQQAKSFAGVSGNPVAQAIGQLGLARSAAAAYSSGKAENAQPDILSNKPEVQHAAGVVNLIQSLVAPSQDPLHASKVSAAIMQSGAEFGAQLMIQPPANYSDGVSGSVGDGESSQMQDTPRAIGNGAPAGTGAPMMSSAGTMPRAPGMNNPMSMRSYNPAQPGDLDNLNPMATQMSGDARQNASGSYAQQIPGIVGHQEDVMMGSVKNSGVMGHVTQQSQASNAPFARPFQSQQLHFPSDLSSIDRNEPSNMSRGSKKSDGSNYRSFD